MPDRKHPAQLPETTVIFGRSFLAVFAAWACLALPGLAQTAEPTSTTATYGTWTVRCAVSAPAGASKTSVKACEMTTKLILKGSDGQAEPLLQVSIGQPLGSDTARVVLQVPIAVTLRDPATVSLDRPTAPGDAQQVVAQEPLLSVTYLTCSPRGCLAETEIAADLVGRLKATQTMNVSFTVSGGKRIMVPVPLTGFAEAAAALRLRDK